MVRGEKRQEQEKKEGGFHRIERSYGSFQRALNLPDTPTRNRSRPHSRMACSRSRWTSARPVRPSRALDPDQWLTLVGSLFSKPQKDEAS